MVRLDDVPPQQDGGGDSAEVKEELVTGNVETNLRRLLTEAVKKRMIGQRRIGCMLSGGLDSSLITSLVHRYVVDAQFGFSDISYSSLILLYSMRIIFRSFFPLDF